MIKDKKVEVVDNYVLGLVVCDVVDTLDRYLSEKSDYHVLYYRSHGNVCFALYSEPYKGDHLTQQNS